MSVLSKFRSISVYQLKLSFIYICFNLDSMMYMFSCRPYSCSIDWLNMHIFLRLCFPPFRQELLAAFVLNLRLYTQKFCLMSDPRHQKMWMQNYIPPAGVSVRYFCCCLLPSTLPPSKKEGHWLDVFENRKGNEVEDTALITAGDSIWTWKLI